MPSPSLIEKFTARDLILRTVTPEDSALIWEWRNDPEVRAISFSQDVIDWQTHQNWVEAKLVSPTCLWLIAEHFDLGMLGHIRFDICQPNEARVAVTVAPALRGRGIGKALIGRGVEEAFSQLPVGKIIGQIKPHNEASERAFRQVGFKVMQPTLIKDALAHQFCICRPASSE